MTIPFNKPPYTGQEQAYVVQAMQSAKLSGDGFFSQKAQTWLAQQCHSQKTLLTPSCTAALEMAALLLNIQQGDEVIMPSYTFVSTANAFVLRGARIVFVDIRPDTMNINEQLIEAAITPRTKAIVPVHYAGVSCAMTEIMALAAQYQLAVVEDAAQGVMAGYQGKPLGSIGTFGCFSFHDTKNYTAGGEGGALLINEAAFISRAEIIREKGTNRSQFFRGMVDKYTWVDVGSSYLPSEIQAAYLCSQLENAEKINQQRLQSWHCYNSLLEPLAAAGCIGLPIIPSECSHNAHMFYIKLADAQQRQAVIDFLKQQEIQSAFHYVPLHSAPYGQKVGHFVGEDKYTTRESERLLRLPLWYGLTVAEIEKITTAVKNFFKA